MITRREFACELFLVFHQNATKRKLQLYEGKWIRRDHFRQSIFRPLSGGGGGGGKEGEGWAGRETVVVVMVAAMVVVKVESKGRL